LTRRMNWLPSKEEERAASLRTCFDGKKGETGKNRMEGKKKGLTLDWRSDSIKKGNRCAMAVGGFHRLQKGFANLLERQGTCGERSEKGRTARKGVATALCIAGMLWARKRVLASTSRIEWRGGGTEDPASKE